MRRRILLVALSAVLLAVALFGIPLAVAVNNTMTTSELRELERLALSGAVAVPPGFQHDPVELPVTEVGVQLGLYDLDGNLVAGTGPQEFDADVSGLLNKDVLTAQTQDEVMVSVPVSSGENVIAVVRAASARSALAQRIRWAWAGLGGLALVAAGCAGGLAAAQSRRLSRPLLALEEAATELGGGNFAVRTERSGVPEIDRAGASLDRTAARLAELLARERAFSAHASHQLRTPLATLRLQLESGLQAGHEKLQLAASEAIRSADQLEQTIDEVLSLARGAWVRGDGFDVDELFDDVRQRWHGILAAANRPLRFVIGEPVPSSASFAATRQALDVLIDNAYRHGEGAVTVRARGTNGALAIDVMDEGRAPDHLTTVVESSTSRVPGRVAQALGLPLARSLAEAEGGRLLLADDETGTRYTLLLPPRSSGQTT